MYARSHGCAKTISAPAKSRNRAEDAPRTRRGRAEDAPRTRRGRAEDGRGDQIAFYAKPKLLVIDERGYLPLEKQTAHLFFQLVSRRNELGSILITTNQTITQWGARVRRRDDCVGRPRLDRVLHDSHVLMIQGDSFRLRP